MPTLLAASLGACAFLVQVSDYDAALAASAAGAATPSPAAGAADAEAADAAFQSRDWARAHELYERAAARQPGAAMVQFRLAVTRLYTGDTRGGLAALDTAERLGWSPPQVAYRRATAHAAAGELDAAVAELQKAAAAGFAQLALLDQDPLLAKLRADGRWSSVRESVDRAVHPCKFDPRYRAFDYWLGTWDVRATGAPPTSPAAENVVTLEYDQCVVHEHWKSMNSSGESFNVYDASRDEWFQTWVDDGGGLHQYHGKPDAKGEMRFLTDLQYAPGQPRLPTRLAFLRLGPDEVRQLSEQSADGGKTWTVNYDLDYRRRPGTTAATSGAAVKP